MADLQYLQEETNLHTFTDWDGDGDIDIIVNSITGRIVWFENIGTVTSPQLTQPKAIEVEWEP